mmetsp:Transcript_115609/g.210459  ORF Transcript_115609/g.210459 Transcript_115609/m.210459 type:complete len:104 (-) Transcript_115609:6-317(-)
MWPSDAGTKKRKAKSPTTSRQSSCAWSTRRGRDLARTEQQTPASSLQRRGIVREPEPQMLAGKGLVRGVPDQFPDHGKVGHSAGVVKHPCTTGRAVSEEAVSC